MKTKNRFNQVFNNSFGELQTDLENMVQQLFGDRVVSRPNTATNWVPRSDVSESEAGYEVELELPGLTADDINIEIKEGILEVAGESKRADLAEGEKALRRERAFGAFRRKFEFPVTVDADKISAEFNNGILKLRIPKSEKVLPREIEINVATS